MTSTYSMIYCICDLQVQVIIWILNQILSDYRKEDLRTNYHNY